MHAEPEKNPRGEDMYRAYELLNKITVDQLHAALREAGPRIVKLELLSSAIHVPWAARDIPPRGSASPA